MQVRRITQISGLNVFDYLLRIVTIFMLASNLFPLLTTTKGPIAGQDEAIVLLYTDQVIRGSLNYLDFHTVYPYPLNFFLSPIVRLFSNDLISIRVLQLGLLFVFSLLALTGTNYSKWRVLSVLSLLTCYWSTVATYWSFALLTWGVGFIALKSGKAWSHGISGLFLGLSVSFRPDFLVLVLPIWFGIWIDHRTIAREHKQIRIVEFAFGIVCGLLPVSVNICQLVLYHDFLNWQKQQSLIRSGRFLPIRSTEQISWIFVILIVYISYAAYLYRLQKRRPSVSVGFPLIWTSLLGSFCFSIFHALQRLDIYHMHYFATLTLITFICHCSFIKSDGRKSAGRIFALTLIATTITTSIPVINFELFKLRTPLAKLDETRNDHESLCGPRRCIPVARNAIAYKPIIEYLSANSSKSVFVGSNDLNSAFYSDNFLYLLLDNPTCSSYLEMNPGGPNRENFDLGKDLEDCDYLVLNSVYDGVVENDFSLNVSASVDRNILKSDFYLVQESFGIFVYSRK